MRNLIPHFIQEEYKKGNFEGNFEALTMFVDVSGFTPMTQALMKHGHEGAEILAKIMNGIFDLLIDAVYECGGFVSVFAGDAFTAIFPIGGDVIPANEFVLHVFACVGRIQSVFLRHGIQTTPYGQFTLQFKVGLSGGTVNWGIVGKTEKTFFFRGEAIDGCAISEHRADKGDIIFDEQVAQAIRKAPRIAGSAWNSSRLQGGYYRLHDIPKAADQLKRPKLARSPRSSKKVVSRFFPEALIDLTEIGEFLNLQVGIEDDMIRGGAMQDAAFMMDGLMVVDNRTNTPLMNVNLSAIQEMNVIKGGFNAEYGNVRSGLINVVTKDGDEAQYNGSVDFHRVHDLYDSFCAVFGSLRVTVLQVRMRIYYH